MGCQVDYGQGTLSVRGGALNGVDVDMNDISDTVMTLAAVACFAAGPTTIRNVAHIRHKETDRLAALATELRRLGAGVDEFADGLTITPRPLHGAVDRNVQRPSHGHEPGPYWFTGAGGHHRQPWLRGQDLSAFL